MAKSKQPNVILKPIFVELLFLLIIFVLGAWGYSHFFDYDTTTSIYHSMMSMTSIMSPSPQTNAQKNFVTIYSLIAVASFFTIVGANVVRSIRNPNSIVNYYN